MWASKYARIGAAVLVVALIVALITFLPVTAYIEDFLRWVQSFGKWAGLVFALVYVVATVAFIPGTPITLAAGFVFGLIWGGIIVHAASTLSAAASFVIGRFIARDWVAERIEEYPRFDAIFRAIDKEGFKVVFLSRLVPVFPFGVLNYGFAVTGVSFWKYISASFIGMIPATVVYVYMGSIAGGLARVATGEAELTPLQDALFWAGGLAAVGIIVILTRRARAELDKLAAEAQQDAAAAEEFVVDQMEAPELRPDDEHNRRLVENVHPLDWKNPLPTGAYNLVVIGAGTGGLVSAAGAAGLGARVALIERYLMGGDCLNHGCVPSKALLQAARAVADVRRAAEFSVELDGEPRVDFPAIMERMRRLRADISADDSAGRFQQLGVDVHLGHARFVAPDAVEVAGQTLAFDKAIIATGARPLVPPIDGLEEAGFLTNESVFTLTELPARLAVLGGGPIGSELAQAFRCFGAQVTLFEMEEQLLPRESSQAAAIVERALRDDGVDLRLGATVTGVRRDGELKIVEFEAEDGTGEIEVDDILVAAGRRPNVGGLCLKAAEVDYDDETGVDINDHLQTSNRDIYAVGDVASKYHFTHLADATARVALKNALFFGRKKLSSLVVPWVTYTDPEIAHVGMYEEEAKERGYQVDTFVEHFHDVDRALLAGHTDGLLEVRVDKRSGEILGATMVARNAGEMISEITLAMQADVGLSTIADTIHPYPTESEAIKHVADAYNRTRLKGWMKSALETYFEWRR